MHTYTWEAVDFVFDVLSMGGQLLKERICFLRISVCKDYAYQVSKQEITNVVSFFKKKCRKTACERIHLLGKSHLPENSCYIRSHRGTLNSLSARLVGWLVVLGLTAL